MDRRAVTDCHFTKGLEDRLSRLSNAARIRGYFSPLMAIPTASADVWLPLPQTSESPQMRLNPWVALAPQTSESPHTRLVPLTSTFDPQTRLLPHTSEFSPVTAALGKTLHRQLYGRHIGYHSVEA